MLRFARMLVDGMGAEGWDVELCSPRAVFGGRGGRPAYTGLGKWLAYVDKYVLFPRALRRRVRMLGPGAVVHIADHSNAPYVPAAASAGHRVLITCHDLGAVRGALGEATDCPASRTGRLLQRWIQDSLGKADAIACVSSATREDVDRLVRRPDGSPPDTRLLFLGLHRTCAYLPPAEAAARLRDLPGVGSGAPFVLHVGSSIRRKNREGVLRVFARTRTGWPEGWLVFAGEPLTAEQHALAASLGLGGRVVEVARPTDGLLDALYARAAALLFPSTFEGFGWPVLEAQAFGCPVLCSDAGSLLEVAGDGAFVRPAADEGGFAAELLRVVREPAARGGWVRAGLENAARFSTSAMLAQYAALYELLAATPEPTHAAAAPAVR